MDYADAQTPSPTKKQLRHENQVYREMMAQQQQCAINHAEQRNYQFHEAAKRYSEYAQEISSQEVKHQEKISEQQYQANLDMFKQIGFKGFLFLFI